MFINIPGIILEACRNKKSPLPGVGGDSHQSCICCFRQPRVPITGAMAMIHILGVLTMAHVGMCQNAETGRMAGVLLASLSPAHKRYPQKELHARTSFFGLRMSGVGAHRFRGDNSGTRGAGAPSQRPRRRFGALLKATVEPLNCLKGWGSFATNLSWTRHHVPPYLLSLLIWIRKGRVNPSVQLFCFQGWAASAQSNMLFLGNLEKSR